MNTDALSVQTQAQVGACLFTTATVFSNATLFRCSRQFPCRYTKFVQVICASLRDDALLSSAIASRKGAPQSAQMVLVFLQNREEFTLISCGRLINDRKGQPVGLASAPSTALLLTPFVSFVLANTETLHEKINVLANRVRHLEDALSQSHALNSHDTHPLLSEDLLQLKRPLERERADGGLGIEERPEAAEAVHALGSL